MTNYETICGQFISELQTLITIHKNATASIRDGMVEIGVKEEGTEKVLFASEVQIYTPQDKWGIRSKASIQVCTSGSFDNKNIASMWRTIHAAGILQNWEAVIALCEEYVAKIHEELCYPQS